MPEQCHGLHEPMKPHTPPWLALPRRWLSSIKQRTFGWTWPNVRWNLLAEWVVIVLWAMWVGRVFLNLDPNAWPYGPEFGAVVHPQLVWTLLPKCGDCMLWNGSMNGGYPAFVDLSGVVLHPLVAITTLLWGAINSAKITIVASLVMAGLAQWWLARVMGLGVVPRLWSAALAVVGGHLAWRINSGIFPLLLSTAAASLVIAPGLELALTRSRRAIVWLGGALALLFVSGQGYMQMGVIVGLLPAFLVFLFGDGTRLRPVWKDLMLAGILAVLLSAIFWVPLAQFWPHFAKDADFAFSEAQPLEYSILNLVIHDAEFYNNEALHKVPYPYLNVNYIGWIPVLLAILALRLVPRSASRLLAFFLVAIGLVYLTSSAITLKLLAQVLPAFAAGVRNPSLISGLAVPLVLALAAWGLDELLQLDWPRLTLMASNRSTSSTPLVSGPRGSLWLCLCSFR